MIKKNIKFIFIIFIVIFIGLTYKYFTNINQERVKIVSLSSMDIFKFDSLSKFSNDKLDTIYNEEKLSKFKTIMNSLDTSDKIKKIELPKDTNVESFEYYVQVKPNLKYIKEPDGYFLLNILIGNSDGKSYITFSGTELSYELDKDKTIILKEIFSDVKH
ncbi:hypothetical protein [Clostridium tagluense]|uniref:hypothetical protein n=1 Tax=Clostridium tagluense TaxID=360422 RepID=UPI0021623D09|nr:hypothetical protein [Clostridium tagluense]